MTPREAKLRARQHKVAEILKWAGRRGFTVPPAGQWKMITRKNEHNQPIYRLRFGPIRVQLFARVRTPPNVRRFVRGPFVWRLVASAPYNLIRVRGYQLTGLRLSNAKR